MRNLVFEQVLLIGSAGYTDCHNTVSGQTNEKTCYFCYICGGGLEGIWRIFRGYFWEVVGGYLEVFFGGV